LISAPNKLVKAENYGAMKYIKGMKLSKKTGELTPAKKDVIPTIDNDLIQEEEKFDGYYAIVTSELDMPDDEVIARYKGLWKIEETFKITKTTLKARPVYVRKDDSIEAHFLSCFLAVLILRLLELETGGKYSPKKMIDSLNKANVCLLTENTYQAVYYDAVLKTIDEALGTTLNKKYLTLEEIKKLVSDTK
ncbi:MAG: transposase, partial [Clostridiales bacterium]